MKDYQFLGLNYWKSLGTRVTHLRDSGIIYAHIQMLAVYIRPLTTVWWQLSASGLADKQCMIITRLHGLLHRTCKIYCRSELLFYTNVLTDFTVLWRMYKYPTAISNWYTTDEAVRSLERSTRACSMRKCCSLLEEMRSNSSFEGISWLCQLAIRLYRLYRYKATASALFYNNLS